MNIIILMASDFLTPLHVRLRDRRADHLRNVLQAEVGQPLSLGMLNGNLGSGCISYIDHLCVDIDLTTPPGEFSQAPPATLPATLVLGLPRPRMLQRTLQTIATMGVQRLCLIHSARVEKSFWQTPLLKLHAIEEQLILGLEQGKATQLPRVELHPNWRNFTRDVMPTLLADHPQKILAHPGPFPCAGTLPPLDTLVAVGPEGGFLPEEVAQFDQFGFAKVSLGERILRVETAIPVLLAKLF